MQNSKVHLENTGWRCEEKKRLGEMEEFGESVGNYKMTFL